MMKIPILILITLLFFACSTSSDDSAEGNNSDSSKHAELLRSDSINEYGFEKIKVGDSIDDFESLLNEYQFNLDSIPKQEFENKSFDYFYNIFDKTGEYLAILHLDSLNVKIIMIEILSNKLIADEHIKIGSSLKEIIKRYKISDAYFDYHIGLIVTSEDFGGGFGLDYTKINDINFNFEEPHIDSLPDQLEINKIYINKRR